MSMLRKDLHNNLAVKNAFHTAAISSSTTTSGVILDLQGYDAVEFLMQMGNWTDGVYTPSIVEGNAANLSDGVAVSNADNLFGSYAACATALNADDTVAKLGYRVGPFRYIRLDIVSSGVTTGTAALSATAILSNADNMPVA